VFGEKKFNLVVTPIHPPPLGDIKVLSELRKLVRYFILLSTDLGETNSHQVLCGFYCIASHRAN
jgi:hypothetical protein